MKNLFISLVLLATLGPAGSADAAQPARRSSPAPAYLGVGLAQLTPVDRRQRGVPRYGGVLIESVLPSTPASRAGFRPGDVIMRLADKYVYRVQEVITAIKSAKGGDRLKIDIIRNGKWLSAKVRLDARRPGTPRTSPPVPRPGPPRASTPPPRGPRPVLDRLRALEQEVRLLRRAIEQLKTICRKP